jgi:hypothetical protein
MTLCQFNLLNEQEQIEAIWYKNVKLAEREDEDFFYNLYQIDNFYIKEKFIKPDKMRIVFRTFATTTLLEPYLKNIKIDL